MHSSIPGSGFFKKHLILTSVPHCFYFFNRRRDCNAEPNDNATESSYIWKYFITDGQTLKGGSRNVNCSFCGVEFSGCSTTRAAAHILGRPVLGQSKAGIRSCIAINTKDDNRRADLRKAQEELGAIIRSKEDAMHSQTLYRSMVAQFVQTDGVTLEDAPF